MSKYGYGQRRAFQYRLPNAKVEVLQANLKLGFGQLIADMIGVDAARVIDEPEMCFFWAFHDAIVATYGWQLLQVADADAVIKKNFLKCNGRLHDLLGDHIGEGNDNPFVDDALW